MHYPIMVICIGLMGMLTAILQLKRGIRAMQEHRARERSWYTKT